MIQETEQFKQEMDFTITKADDERRIVEGFLSCPVIDSDGEILTLESFTQIMPIVMKRGGSLIEEHSNKICGKVLDWKVMDVPQTCEGTKENGENIQKCKPGIWIQAEVFKDYPTDDESWNAIKSGEIRGFSFGGHVQKYNYECALPGTIVYTDTYPVEIENIKVGDKVLSGDGKFHNVIKTFKRDYKGKIIKLRSFTNGLQLKLTPNHPLPVSQKLNIHTSQNFLNTKKWVQAGDLKPKDFIVISKLQQINKIGTKYIHDIVNNSLEQKNNKFYTQKNCRPLPDFELTKEIFEFFGIYISEGFATEKGSIQICSDDKTCIETDSILKTVFSNGVKYYPYKTLHPHCAAILFSCKPFSTLLRNLFKCKSWNKEFPYWFIESAHFPAFVRGLWKGDGTKINAASKNNTGLRIITTTSKKLALQLILGLRQWGYNASITSHERKPQKYRFGQIHARHIAYNVDIHGPQSQKFAKEFLNIEWERNRQVSDHQKSFFEYNDEIYYPIKEIEEIDYEGPVYNLEVQDDQTYFANGILVHNCNKEAGGCYNKANGLSVFEISIVRRPANPVAYFTNFNKMAKSQSIKTLIESVPSLRSMRDELVKKGTPLEEAIGTVRCFVCKSIEKMEDKILTDWNTEIENDIVKKAGLQSLDEFMNTCGFCQKKLKTLIEKGVSETEAKSQLRSLVLKALVHYNKGGDNMTTAENITLKEAKDAVVGDALRELKEVVQTLATKLEDVGKKIAQLKPGEEKPSEGKKPEEKPEKPVEKPAELPKLPPPVAPPPGGVTPPPAPKMGAPRPVAPPQKEEEEARAVCPTCGKTECECPAKEETVGAVRSNIAPQKINSNVNENTDKEEELRRKEEELRLKEEELRRKEEEILAKEEERYKYASRKDDDKKKKPKDDDEEDRKKKKSETDEDEERKKSRKEEEEEEERKKKSRKEEEEEEERKKSVTKAAEVAKFDPHRDATDLIVNLEKDLRKIYETYETVKKSFDDVAKSLDYKPRATQGTTVLGKIEAPVRNETVLGDSEGKTAKAKKEEEEEESSGTGMKYNPRATSDTKLTLGKVQEVKDDIRVPPQKLSAVLAARKALKSAKELEEKLRNKRAEVVATTTTPKPLAENNKLVAKSEQPTLQEVGNMSWAEMEESNARFQMRKRLS